METAAKFYNYLYKMSYASSKCDRVRENQAFGQKIVFRVFELYV